GDALGRLPGDVVVMVRVAADDGTEAHEGGVAPALRQAPGHGWYLVRPGHPDDIDGVLSDAVPPQRIDRTADQLLDDEMVEARGHEGEASGRRREGAFVDGHRRASAACGLARPLSHKRSRG